MIICVQIVNQSLRANVAQLNIFTSSRRRERFLWLETFILLFGNHHPSSFSSSEVNHLVAFDKHKPIQVLEHKVLPSLDSVFLRPNEVDGYSVVHASHYLPLCLVHTAHHITIAFEMGTSDKL